MAEEEKNKHLWDQFIRLGERIGDGDLDASESRWMNREYKKLSRILVPEINEAYKEQIKAKALRINEQIKNLIAIKNCKCGGSLRQSRSGSVICYCNKCDKRYKATSKKTNN